MGRAMLKNCVICQKPATDKFRPFCSARCADIDLGRWFNETYAVPTGEAEKEDDDKASSNED